MKRIAFHRPGKIGLTLNTTRYTLRDVLDWSTMTQGILVVDYWSRAHLGSIPKPFPATKAAVLALEGDLLALLLEVRL